VSGVHGWIGFLAWAAGGVLTSVAVAAAASFGLFLLPVAVAALILLAGRVRVWPEALGALEGLAATALLIGFLNVGRSPCPRSGTFILRPGQHEAGCGGIAPAPYLIVGCVLAVLGVVLYHRLRDAR
jgi:hypothetical protein